MSFQVDAGDATQNEESSTGSSVGNLANTECRVYRDMNMPDGDACRPDGTLKDASEMNFPNSPSDATHDLPDISKDEYFFLNLEKNLPNDATDDATEEENEDKLSSKSGWHPKVKFSHIFNI